MGNTIDPNAVIELCNAIKDCPDEPLETYGVRGYARLNNSQKKNIYTESFINLFNKSLLSDEFDSTDSQSIFKMFLSKIEDGTLEIRMTGSQEYGKAFILTNKYEYLNSSAPKKIKKSRFKVYLTQERYYAKT